MTDAPRVRIAFVECVPVTLAEMLPSLRGSLPRRLAPGAWPASTRHLAGGDLTIGGLALRNLARIAGTPAAVIDLQAYEAGVLGVGRFVHASSAAELATAAVVELSGERGGRSAGLPGPAHGTVLVEHAAGLRELERRGSVTTPTAVVLAIAPRGRRRSPGHDDNRAAFDPSGAAFADAVRTVLASPRLTLSGLYGRADGPDAVLPTVRFGVEVAASLRATGAVVDRLLVRLETQPDAVGDMVAVRADDLACEARRAVRLQTAALGVVAPQLLLDAGPLVAPPCEVAVHRITDVVASAGEVRARIDCATDDLDLGDPAGVVRPAHLLTRLSGAPDTIVRLTARRGPGGGRDVVLPLDVAPGDLVAVPAVGRIGLSVCRHAPLLGVRDGAVVPLLAGLTTTPVGRSVTA